MCKDPWKQANREPSWSGPCFTHLGKGEAILFRVTHRCDNLKTTIPTPKPSSFPSSSVPSPQYLGRKALAAAQKGNSLSSGERSGTRPSLIPNPDETWSKSPDLSVPLNHSQHFLQPSSLPVLNQSSQPPYHVNRFIIHLKILRHREVK